MLNGMHEGVMILSEMSEFKPRQIRYANKSA